MIYPAFLKEKDTIGVTAPSDGITKKADLYRLDSAIHHFEQQVFFIKETQNVRNSTKGKSSSSIKQAKELEYLWKDKNIKMVFCASGGDFLLEMLSYLDFSILKKNPKWIQGFSDPTGILYIITTNLDVATIYGNNFSSFGMNPWHQSLENNLEILKGNLLIQHSFNKYEAEYTTRKIGDEPYQLTKKVYWKNLNQEEIQVTGRIIGGCLDILNDLFGTRFDNTLKFIQKYKHDGIIWYFDICEFSSEQIIRTFWKLKDNGWFKYTKCIIIGRIGKEVSYYDISYQEAIQHSLQELNIPIIINADIGHVSPRMTIINGAIATVSSKNGKGKIGFQLI